MCGVPDFMFVHISLLCFMFTNQHFRSAMAVQCRQMLSQPGKTPT